MTAADASRPVGGNSVAAHAHHVALAASAWVRGSRVETDWSQTWAVSAVDDAGWRQLQDRLRAGYGDLKAAIRDHGGPDEMAAGCAVGAVAHTGYHPGAIKQKIASPKKAA